MGPLLHELALLQNANTVCFLNGRKSMGNDEAGAAGTEILQCLLHESLGLIVERGRRFIQQQKRWIL